MMDKKLPRNRAAFRLKGGGVILASRIEVTPAGLLAIAGLVSSVLLSVALVVDVAAAARNARRLR